MRKKLLCVLLAAALTCCLLGISSLASNPLDFTLAAGVDSAEPLDSFSVTVSIDSNDGFSAADFLVEYDPAVLSPVSLVFGSILDTMDVTDSNLAYSSNKIAFSAVTTELFTGTGTLATITFNVLRSAAVGTTALTLTAPTLSSFADGNFTDLQCSVTNDSVSITALEQLSLIDGASLELNSGFVTNLDADAIVSAARAQFSNTGLVFKDAGGTVLSETDPVRTGCTVSLLKNGNVIDSASFVLFGDLNGDGKINGMDAFLVSLLADGSTDPGLSDAAEFAADVSHDGVINTDDFSAVKNGGAKKDTGINQSRVPVVINEMVSNSVVVVAQIMSLV